MSVRDEVLAFVRFGTLPSENDAENHEVFQARADALHAIDQPITDEEATLLATCFGDDNCFGLAWTLLHLIETAPTPLVTAEPPEGSNEWIILCWRRYQNYLTIQPGCLWEPQATPQLQRYQPGKTFRSSDRK